LWLGSKSSKEGVLAGQSVKQKVLEAVEGLPPDATVEDAMERLYFLAKPSNKRMNLPVRPVTRLGVAPPEIKSKGEGKARARHGPQAICGVRQVLGVRWYAGNFEEDEGPSSATRESCVGSGDEGGP
jgi:hypothetical protein